MKEALSVLLLWAPVFIFTSGSSALLGRPRCGLSVRLLLLSIFNTLFGIYVNVFHEKTDKTRKYSKAETKMAADGLSGAQSINTERASNYFADATTGCTTTVEVFGFIAAVHSYYHSSVEMI